jgi:formylglycine-generating enzyme required for sulfatase activity
VGIEDDVSLLTPGEYHADTSPLVQLLRKGHHGVRLEAEDWDRLVTWLDLNAPCHGTWGEVYPIPDGMHERRMALRKECGGPEDDPERLAMTSDALRMTKHVQNARAARSPAANPAPIDSSFIIRHSSLAGLPREKTIDLGNGIALKLVPIPAGEFAMGDPNGAEDERPRSRVTIPDAFWMAEGEISNEQYRQFDSSHDPRYYGRRHARSDDQGLPLNDPKQPVVRVSWNDAMAFCRWLSAKSGLRFSLPTEAQWEWACRAGSVTRLSFGGCDADFSRHANLADESFGKGLVKDGKQVTGGLEHLVLEGAALSDGRFNDGAVVTAEVGRGRPNAWGLREMHGNAAEWTRSQYRPYPYRADDGRNEMNASERKVVRGGSFFDPPRRAGSGYRLAYPAWQRVFNVGFRVVCEGKEAGVAVKNRGP